MSAPYYDDLTTKGPTPMAAKKRMKPFKAWAIVFGDGYIKGVYATGVPYVFKTKALANNSGVFGGRVVRVEIREVL